MEFWEKALFVDKISLMIIGANEDKKSSLLQDVLAHSGVLKAIFFKGVSVYRTKDGIFVIDSIETEMHPTRQREIILQLDQAFPNTQFAISTNSPLCLSGTADVGKDKYKIYKIFLDEDGDEVIEERGIPQGLRADQVLVDYFDLETSLNISTESVLSDLRNQYAMGPEKRDETEIASLKKKLKKFNFGLAERVCDRNLQQKLLGLVEEDKERKTKESIALRHACGALLDCTGACPGIVAHYKVPECENCSADDPHVGSRAVNCWIKYFMEEKK